MLMGCSSGNRDEGKFDPHGMVHAYLTGAPHWLSPPVDVTDKDIDRFCVNLLEMLCDDGENQCRNSVGVSVLDAVSSARKVCE